MNSQFLDTLPLFNVHFEYLHLSAFFDDIEVGQTAHCAVDCNFSVFISFYGLWKQIVVNTNAKISGIWNLQQVSRIRCHSDFSAM